MKKVKVLATYIESGMGHITSIQAIVDSLNKNPNANCELVESYIMHGNRITEEYEKFLTKQVKQTNSCKFLGKLIFFSLDVLGAQYFMRLCNRTIFRKSMLATIEQIRKQNPDIVLSTHYYITFCALEYKRLYNPNCKVITYNPDNNTHCWWDGRDGMFLVNNPMARREAIRRGFKRENIVDVNSTVRQVLLETNGTKTYYRNKFNLPYDKFTVVVADGAYALAKSKPYTMELIKTDKPITILFIAGHNDKMFDYMMSVKKRLALEGRDNITLEVYRFLPNIHELYRAADLFITKGGPNSIYDSLYMGTPVVVNFCPQPMEKAAYTYYVKQCNCGFGVFNRYKIRPLVEKIIDNPSILDVPRQNLTKFRNIENGSDQIARYINEVVNSYEPIGQLAEGEKEYVLEQSRNPFDYEESNEQEKCKVRHSS